MSNKYVCMNEFFCFLVLVLCVFFGVLKCFDMVL